MSKPDAKKRKQLKAGEVTSLFDALSDVGPEEYDKRLALCNQILKLAPADKDALQIKVVNLIQLARNEEAEKLMTSANLTTELAYEYAYVLYRLNKTAEARTALSAIPETDGNRDSLRHLLAQLNHKEENFEAAAQLYQSFLDATMDEAVDPEVMCNLLACRHACPPATLASAMDVARLQQHWETCFNVACSFVDQEKWKEAWSTLQDCSDLCAAAAKELEWSERQLQDERCIIAAQQAFVALQLGNRAGCRGLLERVLRDKPSSVQATAVAEINWVALSGAKNLFEAYRRIRHAASHPVDSKLTARQRLAVRQCHAALLLRMGKGDACRSACEALIQQHPASDVGPLLLAALHAHERRMGKAEDVLRAFIRAHPGSAVPLRAQLTLAQLQLQQGQAAAAAATLAQVHALEHKPGLLAYLVKLHCQAKQPDGAIKTLDSAIASLSASPPTPSTKAQVLTLLTKSAELKLQEKRYREAAEAYEHGLQLSPTDSVLLSGLVVALAAFDPEKAERQLTKLPTSVDPARLAALLGDVRALEDIPVPRDPKHLLKKRKVAESDEMEVDERKKTQKKKKRRVRHPPRVMDGKPDPERWLPLRERSYYKKPAAKKSKLKKESKKR